MLVLTASAFLAICWAVDADTISCPTFSRHIRVAAIDAPESHRPQCQAERDLAAKAKAFTREFLSEPVEIVLTGYDNKWDRYEAYIRRGGVDLGTELIRHGLAREYTRGRRLPWCP